MISKTYEPIRPLYGAWAIAEAYKVLFGGWRVFYGWSYWPSYSYSDFGTVGQAEINICARCGIIMTSGHWCQECGCNV
jgi:hypothetical protein